MSTFFPREVFIVAAKRTPFGSFMGSLRSLPPPRLAAHAITSALSQANVSASAVEELMLGHLYGAGLGQAPTRQACIYAGLPESTICTSINKTSTSGIKSINLAASTISLGISDIIMAGGMESMSQCPFLLKNYRTGQTIGDSKAIDSLTYDGLFCQINQQLMGACCDQTNLKFNVSREEQDQYAIESYQRAASGWARGFFEHEVVPIEFSKGKVLEEDEEYKRVHFEKIPKLKPAFGETGSITSANASTINDGACALLLMSGEKMKEMGVKPLAKILSSADIEIDTVHFGSGPHQVVKKALARANLTVQDVDLFEINEAFSSVAVLNIRELGVNRDIVNVNGGAVSIGHPVGTSGARIVTTLIYALMEQNKKIGAAGICNGGGGSTGLVIEIVN